MSDAPAYKNAIWILGNQHPAHALSCNGDPNLDTPHLDRLAAEGQNDERAVDGCKGHRGICPKAPAYREVVYRAARYGPGSGFEQLLTEDALDKIIARLGKNGTL